ncbi:PIN domain-containing protein [Roseiarcus sp.]|uniref:PIN domain-containing protein n=1 Tax=Roseiarcus sp. TaxID=1969460 RepID=UPI003F99AA23
MSLFFDTNVLVYAFLDVEKRERALEVLAQGGVISAQALNANLAGDRGGDRRRPQVVSRRRPLTSATHAGAVALARDHGFAFYDALIVAAALEAECDTLYSEDMQHGRDVAGLTIVNPFAKPAR